LSQQHTNTRQLKKNFKAAWARPTQHLAWVEPLHSTFFLKKLHRPGPSIWFFKKTLWRLLCGSNQRFNFDSNSPRFGRRFLYRSFDPHKSIRYSGVFL